MRVRRAFRKLGTFIENKHLLIFIIGLLLIIPAVFGASGLEMATGNETFISTNSKVYKDYEKFNQQFSGNVILVLLVDDDFNQLVRPDNLAAMEAIETQTGSNPDVISAIGPAFFIKQTNRLDSLPNDSQEILDIVTDPDTGNIVPHLRQVFPDKEHALIFITLEGGLERDREKAIIDEFKEIVGEADFNEIDNVIISGNPVVMVEIEDMMAENMQKMFILSVVLMLIILAVIFKVRGFFAWRWLPLGVVFIGITYAFGAMGALSIPLTMVSMGAFPILIGLGVDYAIQFHNRFDEESRRGETVADAIVESVTNIGLTIGIAIITACLGFSALFFSPVPMIRDFASTLIIGVAACYFLSMFFLLAILHWHHRRRFEIRVKKNSKPLMQGRHWLDEGLHLLAPWVIKHPAIILPIALIPSVLGLIADSHIETETDEQKFISQDIQVMIDVSIVQEIASGITFLNLFIESDDVSTPPVLHWMIQFEEHIAGQSDEFITRTESIAGHIAERNDGSIPQDSQQIEETLQTIPGLTKLNLMSQDGKTANLVLTLKEYNEEYIRDLQEQLSDYISDNPPPDGVSVAITGEPILKLKLMDGLTSGREEMTLIGIVIIFFGLLVLFRLKILRVFTAVLPIALIIGWSSGIMYLLGIKYTPMTATIGALIIGIGVEFTILLMMRYHEERRRGSAISESMITAMTMVGRAIIASGMTVICGFGTLLIADDFLILRDFGIVTLINVFFALVSTLFVLPTLIVLIDTWRDKRHPRRSQ